ncbi:right-handed parallel beta-helix repeat-containing protein [Chondromyces apiculatus]|uniref:Right handed beta helix domain-containing protein n=1 Tax=Chondromyces apiculatus DSM 436 TaxID=1192034 RepID=A0A017TG76_9BACT|nr:right-handed parallel beta-helix repeat-containing protein [Chondromyces apiculatus]EYF07830.1 Hypothetical protein CAP_6852 [Chondromyces apiculatus DSM 436]
MPAPRALPRRPAPLFLAPPALAAALALSAGDALAADIDADPSTYQALVPTLQPGDTLHLAPGEYLQNLVVQALNGTPEAPISITGPEDKGAVLVGNGNANTVEITDASHVVLKDLTIDGKNLPNVFGVSAKNGNANTVHHITIEGCVFRGHGGSQQTVAISTKAPTWGWIIRRNLIDGAGTGMYLGNSDGQSPFVEGLIENNLIRNTIGYGAQIKHQTAWPINTGLPATPTRTIIRHNVFLKNDAPSPDGDRPNLLVGGLPPSGLGADNGYDIYGNFFFHNPREALLQASGRVSIHDNIFVDAVDAAIVLTNHEMRPLLRAHVYNNTIYGAERGIRFANAAADGDLVLGNLIFAAQGLTGPVASDVGNEIHALADAPTVVVTPSLTLGQMDFYPLPGKAQGDPLDLSLVAAETDADRDFNGVSKADHRFRGAYAGAGVNRGWPLSDDFKEEGVTGEGGSSGEGGGGATGGSGPGTGGAGANAAGSESDEGCGCTVAGNRAASDASLLALLFTGALLARRRYCVPWIRGLRPLRSRWSLPR